MLSVPKHVDRESLLHEMKDAGGSVKLDFIAYTVMQAGGSSAVNYLFGELSNTPTGDERLACHAKGEDVAYSAATKEWSKSNRPEA